MTTARLPAMCGRSLLLLAALLALGGSNAIAQPLRIGAELGLGMGRTNCAPAVYLDGRLLSGGYSRARTCRHRRQRRPVRPHCDLDQARNVAGSSSIDPLTMVMTTVTLQVCRRYRRAC